VLAAGLAMAACVPNGPVPVAGLMHQSDGDKAYRAYLDGRPRQLKLRHQVETHFADHDEFVSGYLVLAPGGRLLLRAMSPLGASLFEIRNVPPAPPVVTSNVPQLSDPKWVEYLLADLRRIYLLDCPATHDVAKIDGRFAVECELPCSSDRAPSPPEDDGLRTEISDQGLVMAKKFRRRGEATAHIVYADYRLTAGLPLAHRITLDYPMLHYAMTIALIDADTKVDVARLFAPEDQPDGK